ncbi:MAG: hypothetical protein MK479_13425, partial [Planctomycetes bacterium]|nr:hypothetical protein [Planctomycetota bacterium]
RADGWRGSRQDQENKDSRVKTTRHLQTPQLKRVIIHRAPQGGFLCENPGRERPPRVNNSPYLIACEERPELF